MNAKNDNQHNGPSVTADGRDPLELLEEQAEAVRDMTSVELEAVTTWAADQSHAAREELQADAADRKAMRRMMN